MGQGGQYGARLGSYVSGLRHHRIRAGESVPVVLGLWAPVAFPKKCTKGGYENMKTYPPGWVCFYKVKLSNKSR